MKNLLNKNVRERIHFKTKEIDSFILKSIFINSNFFNLIRLNAYLEFNFLNLKRFSVNKCLESLSKKRFNKLTCFSRHVFRRLIRSGSINGLK